MKFYLTPTLSGFVIVNDSTLIIENWLVLETSFMILILLKNKNDNFCSLSKIIRNYTIVVKIIFCLWTKFSFEELVEIEQNKRFRSKF